MNREKSISIMILGDDSLNKFSRNYQNKVIQYKNQSIRLNFIVDLIQDANTASSGAQNSLFADLILIPFQSLNQNSFEKSFNLYQDMIRLANKPQTTHKPIMFVGCSQRENPQNIQQNRKIKRRIENMRNKYIQYNIQTTNGIEQLIASSISLALGQPQPRIQPIIQAGNKPQGFNPSSYSSQNLILIVVLGVITILIAQFIWQKK